MGTLEVEVADPQGAELPGEEQRMKPRKDPEELGAKGMRTRTALIRAAQTVFERRGFLETTLDEVTREAGVASGTLYTYFTNREELLTALIEDAYAQSVVPAHSRPVDEGDPVERIRAGNLEYVRAFRRNRGLNKILEEARHFDESIELSRLRRGEAFFRRNAETIGALQADGRVPESVDPEFTARSLGLMVSRHCHYVYVYPGDARFDSEEGAELFAHRLTALWLRALGMDEPQL